MESLKQNKDLKGLAKYVGEYVLTTLSTVEKQNVKEVIDCLKIRYDHTILEKINELLTNYVKHNINHPLVCIPYRSS